MSRLDQIAKAHQESVRLQREQREAAARRDTLVRDELADADGAGAAAIATHLGVDRQRVYQMGRR